MDLNKKQKTSSRFIVFLLFFNFFLTLVVTFPLLKNIASGVIGPPPLEDSKIYLWEIDHFGKKIFRDFKNPFIAEDIFYPRGLRFQDMNFTLSAILVSPLGYFLSPTIAYNFWILLGYLASGVITFFLAKHILKNDWGSLITALIFTYSPYHYQVVYNGQLELSGIFWIPLLLLSLILFLERKNIKFAILLAFIFILTALSSGYYGAFALLILLLFPLLYFLFNKGQFLEWKEMPLQKKFKVFSVPLFLVLIFLLPFFLSLYRSDRIKTEIGFEYFKNSFRFEINGGVADIIDYVTPLPFYYKDLGWGYRDWYQWPANCYYVSILLIPALLYYLFSKKRRNIKTFFWLLFIFFILSLGSSLRYDHHLVKIGSLDFIPLPGSILPLIPVISDARIIARLGLIVSLFGSIIIGYFFSNLIRKIKNPIIKVVLIFSTILFFFLESYLFVIPSKIKSSKIPKVYQEIYADREDFSVLEYPLRIAGNYPFNEEELFYKTFHDKKIVFGFSPFRSKSLEEHLEKLGGFKQAKTDFKIDKKYLKEARVKYILINKQKIKDIFGKENIEVYQKIKTEINSLPGLKRLKKIENIEIYQLEQ